MSFRLRTINFSMLFEYINSVVYLALTWECLNHFNMKRTLAFEVILDVVVVMWLELEIAIWSHIAVYIFTISVPLLRLPLNSTFRSQHNNQIVVPRERWGN
ncbi:hypothetical protein V1511DRAFT_492623 [Dipodascopsis uninucleata]